MNNCARSATRNVDLRCRDRTFRNAKIGFATVRISPTTDGLKLGKLDPIPSTPNELPPHALIVPPLAASPTKAKLAVPPPEVAKTPVTPGTSSGDGCGPKSRLTKPS